MSLVTRKILLDTLAKHQTLTVDDLSEKEKLGLVPNKYQLAFLLHQLTIRGHIVAQKGATRVTYSITDDGIKERNRLLNV